MKFACSRNSHCGLLCILWWIACSPSWIHIDASFLHSWTYRWRTLGSYLVSHVHEGRPMVSCGCLTNLNGVAVDLRKERIVNDRWTVRHRVCVFGVAGSGAWYLRKRETSPASGRYPSAASQLWWQRDVVKCLTFSHMENSSWEGSDTMKEKKKCYADCPLLFHQKDVVSCWETRFLIISFTA